MRIRGERRFGVTGDMATGKTGLYHRQNRLSRQPKQNNCFSFGFGRNYSSDDENHPTDITAAACGNLHMYTQTWEHRTFVKCFRR